MNEKQTNGFVSLINNDKDFIDLFVERKLLTKERAEKARRLIYNPLLGFTTAKEVDEALTMGAIKKWKSRGLIRWGIATEEKIKNGKKVLCIARAYLDFTEKRKRRQGAAFYNKESMDNLIHEDKEINVDKLFETFPGSKKTN